MPRPSVEIVALVYRSIDYVNFTVEQLARYARADGYDVSWRLVANDASLEVLEHLSFLKEQFGGLVRYDDFHNPDPNEFYINRVYRAWNYAMRSSAADILCFSGGSDMAYSPDWLDALLRHHDGVNIPCARLVESGGAAGANAGVFREGRHVLFGQFGTTPKEFRQRESEWLQFAAIKTAADAGRVEPYGFYAGWLIDRERFIESGGFPEGNIYRGGVGVHTGWGDCIASGDAWFFTEVLEKKFGMKHCTVFDSLAYHHREGEMRQQL